MNYKNKVAASLAALLIAGVLVPSFQNGVASAQSNTNQNTASIESLQAIVKDLQRQIAYIISLLNKRNQSNNKVVGRNCTYNTYPGNCVVASVRESADGTNATVNFLFDAESQNSLSDKYYTANATDMGMKGCVKGAGAFTAQMADQGCGLHQDTIFKCHMQTIKSGTCTPTIFKFIDPKDPASVTAEQKQCEKTGGNWTYSEIGCIPATKATRLNKNTSCTAEVRSGFTCSCPTGKYYGSLEEGCIYK
ncbi:MAG: hypothetical protein WCX69_03170 [Candidatus Paceibacterota bacterium]